MIFYALTSAGAEGRCWNSSLKGEVWNPSLKDDAFNAFWRHKITLLCTLLSDFVTAPECLYVKLQRCILKACELPC